MCRGAVARGSNGAVAYCLELALEERNAAQAPCGYFSDDHVDREGGQVLLERGQNAHNHAASPGAMICLAGLSRGSAAWPYRGTFAPNGCWLLPPRGTGQK